LLKTVESFNFQQDELEQLESEVNRAMKNGYVFTYDLQFELGFNEQLEPIIQKYNLLNDTTLIAILKWLLPNLYGHSKLLYWKDSSISKLEQVIANEHTDLIIRHEMSQFIERKGYSIQTITQMLSLVIQEKYFYHYTTVQYINAKQLCFSNEVKESLTAYLNEQMKENGYMSVYSMVGFTNELVPISEHQWTEWLIYQFAEQVGFKQIEVVNDYRYDRLILVKEDLQIERFDQLILHILKMEYDGRYHEEDLAHYLESKNLLNNSRQLPNTLHQSPYFTFDSFGFFQIRSSEDDISKHSI